MSICCAVAAANKHTRALLLLQCCVNFVSGPALHACNMHTALWTAAEILSITSPVTRLAADGSQKSVPAGVPGRARWRGGALGAAAGGRALERQHRQPGAGRAALGWRAEPAAAPAPAAGAGRTGGPVFMMLMLCSRDLAWIPLPWPGQTQQYSERGGLPMSSCSLLRRPQRQRFCWRSRTCTCCSSCTACRTCQRCAGALMCALPLRARQCLPNCLGGPSCSCACTQSHAAAGCELSQSDCRIDCSRTLAHKPATSDLLQT